ncbi:GTP cyclohydrolase 1 [Helicobacter heilmannii]|uniref:GTP cyclohydrolase 1 n=1 Tax=Helicobacter heilmannii TaxID=35817 RepID=A0A0K2Y6I3_HELHE|nr:GTP cyclohydrolase I FolE [Helicobacter heilmannii]BDQ27750.1 GTP cyclohydrolase 1 [Helicobacter heilmannii]CRI33702.1 GTP cyclohydrolase I type 1 [Helicobacter heilmannii]
MFKKCLEELFLSVGEDPKREGLVHTPKRVKALWADLVAGYKQDPKEILSAALCAPSSGLVVLQNIEFYSVCEHHLLPFFGRVSVGYLPNVKIVGLGAIVRLVECFSRRLQIQERLSTQIATSLQECLEPRGVGVFCVARHLCVAMQGVQKQESVLKTSCRLGAFEDPAIYQEFLQSLNAPV